MYFCTNCLKMYQIRTIVPALATLLPMFILVALFKSYRQFPIVSTMLKLFSMFRLHLIVQKIYVCNFTFLLACGAIDRTVKLVYKNSDESYKGVKGYRYEVSPTTFRSSTSNVENDCFCSKSTKDASGNDNCYLDGVFDFKPCLGAPILVSQPHFLNADEKYGNAVIGLNPDASKHNIYLLLEPNTGTPLVGMKRIQLNAVMRKEKYISKITPDAMYEAVVPILWLEEGVNLPQTYVDLVNDQYFKSLRIANGIKYALIALFSSLFAVCLFFMWRKEYFKKSSK